MTLHRLVFSLCVLPILLVGAAKESVAAGKKLTVHNRSVKDERSLWFAEYHKSKDGAERKGQPFKVSKRSSKTIESARMAIGHSRYLRWLKQNDFPKRYNNSQWSRINSRKHMGTGKHAVYVSDHKDKGTYRGYYSSEWAFKSTKEFFEKYGKAAADAVKKGWDELSTAGDPCDVINKTTETLYISEYERKTAEAGMARRLQGGSGKSWRVRPGETLKFKKGKLRSPYTWRWVRWQRKEGPPNEIAAGEFRNHGGWKSNSKGINKIYIAFNNDGAMRGYNSVEWAARKLTLRKAAVALIRAGLKSPVSSDVKIPEWLLKAIGLDKLIAAADKGLDTVVKTALGGTDPQKWIRDEVDPIVARVMTDENWSALGGMLTKGKPRMQEIFELLADDDDSSERADAIYDKLRGWGVVPSASTIHVPQRTRGLNDTWEPRHVVGGASIGLTIAVEGRKGKAEVTVTVAVSVSRVWWKDPKTGKRRNANSVGFGVTVAPAVADPKGGGSLALYVGPFFSPALYFMDDPNNAGSHALLGSISYGRSAHSRQNVYADGANLDLIVPIRGHNEKGDLAITGLGVALGVGAAGGPSSGAEEVTLDQDPSWAFGYSYSLGWPR